MGGGARWECLQTGFTKSGILWRECNCTAGRHLHWWCSYLKKSMLLRDVTRVGFFFLTFRTVHAGWMRVLRTAVLPRCAVMKKPPSRTVIKNSRTPLFLRANEVAPILPPARPVFVACVVRRRDANAPARPSSAHRLPPPSSPSREQTFIKLTLQIHRPPRALSWETQGSYIELHEEHNTSTNAQCK